jgi:hypothetical protein
MTLRSGLPGQSWLRSVLGLAASEPEPHELAHVDPDYHVTVGIRAVRSRQV